VVDDLSGIDVRISGDTIQGFSDLFAAILHHAVPQAGAQGFARE
jgi:hypothetical protein